MIKASQSKGAVTFKLEMDEETFDVLFSSMLEVQSQVPDGGRFVELVDQIVSSLATIQSEAGVSSKTGVDFNYNTGVFEVSYFDQDEEG